MWRSAVERESERRARQSEALSGGQGQWPLEKAISTWFLISDGQEHTLILLQRPKHDLDNLTQNHVKLEGRDTPKVRAREGTG